MPVPADEAARRKRGRKYTSRACETCRQRRAKCDGIRPSCSRCLDRGVQCEYSTAEDGRQPAPKSYVVMLRNRIELLERALHAHGIDPDAAIQQMPRNENHQPDTEWAPACSNVDDLCPTFDGALTLDESLNFDQDGEVRYFGPTNSPNEEAYQSDVPSTQTGETPLNESSDALEESLIPDGLRSHLIDLYFEWEQPWFQMVNETLFRDSMTCGGRYFSPLLLNCILALGSRYCDRIEVRSDPNDSNTAGKIFLDQAEKLIQNDLKWPKITTIQSLAIMGMAYIAMGSDAAGWLHQGMANRLALDMGFNMDPSVLSGAVALPPMEIELRRQIYWALYCHDKLSASYTGRVCTLLDSQGVVKKPFPLCASDVYLPSANGSGQLRAASQRDVVQLHRAMIDLCRIFEKVLLSFWSPKPLLQPNQRSAFFDSCVLELKTWYYDLPPELKVDRPSGPSRFPHTYTLCMVYHTVCILLCVPFISNNPADRQTQQNSNHKGPEPDSKQKFMTTCSNSARGMCIVAQKYRQTFGSFKLSPITTTHSMLSAALIIIEKCCVDPTAKSCTGTQASRGPSPQAAVGLCLQVLRELSTSWNIAKRIGRNLEKLYCQRLNCDIDHMPPAPSLEFNGSCTTPCQPADTDPCLGPMAPTEPAHGLLNLKDPYVQNTVLAPPLPNINWFDVPTSNSTQQYDNGGMTGFGAAPNPDEVFINNLGFAFSANCLPSDYNMFDTLNQMYLEDIW
ncbi:Transcription factor [Penicillium cf. griseofulvum]|nr:Transcription factor [Penicillium cf. griseofulvum]